MLTGLFKLAWRDNLILRWQFVVALIEGSILSFVLVMKMLLCMLLLFIFYYYLQSLSEDCVLTNKPSRFSGILQWVLGQLICTEVLRQYFDSKQLCSVSIWQMKMCLVKSKILCLWHVIFVTQSFVKTSNPPKSKIYYIRKQPGTYTVCLHNQQSIKYNACNSCCVVASFSLHFPSLFTVMKKKE